MQTLQDALQLARNHVQDDPNLSVFIVRDFTELKQWHLDDLTWAMFKNYASRSEVQWLLDEIEKRLQTRTCHTPE